MGRHRLSSHIYTVELLVENRAAPHKKISCKAFSFYSGKRPRRMTEKNEDMFIIYILSYVRTHSHHLTLQKMNLFDTWFAPTTPFMRLVLPFLSVEHIEKWRQTCKDAQSIVSISCHPSTWLEQVLQSGRVWHCHHCSKRRGMKKIVFSTCCRRYICQAHILSCCVCNAECCTQCATEHGCLSC